jgi:cell division protease FtsH
MGVSTEPRTGLPSLQEGTDAPDPVRLFFRRHKRTLILLAWLIGLLVVAYYGMVWLLGLPVQVRDPLSGQIQEVTVRGHPGFATRFAGDLFPIFLSQLLRLLLQLSFYLLLLILQFVGLFWYLSRGRTYTIYPKEYDVTFDDVRGQEAAVKATREVLKLFQGFKRFRESGGYPPHGLLFEGPPGTGKTLLAKAVAGEAKVPFIYASGTSFNNMFLGVGNMRVAYLFRKARRLSDRYGGCVIFLDELDALGGSRGAVQMARTGVDQEGRGWGPLRYIVPGGWGWGSMLVNELLVQMDGLVTPRGFFKRHLRRILRRKPTVPQYNILIIGATNRASTLDPALLRPGRFDRKIHVGLPDAAGRKDIAEYYLAKVKHEPIDTDKLARSTVGYSPARIKNIINEALIFALQDGREALNWQDLWQAKLTDEIGLKQPVKYTPREKAMTAIHEAGHAVASYTLQRGERQIQVISIIKRESALGLVHGVPVEETFSYSKDQLLSMIKVSLAGMAAEEIWFGQSGTGPSSDLMNATYLAAQMVGMYGMDSNLVSYGILQNMWGQPDGLNAILANQKLNDAVNEILRTCKAEVTALLKDKAHVVEGIRDALLEREELVGDEISELMAELGEPVDDTPASASYTPTSIVPGRPGYVGPSGNGGAGPDRAAPPVEPVEFPTPPPLL